jgi:hypothetical protein
MPGHPVPPYVPDPIAFRFPGGAFLRGIVLHFASTVKSILHPAPFEDFSPEGGTDIPAIPASVRDYPPSQLPSAQLLRISKSRIRVALLSAWARLSIRLWTKSYSQRIREFRSRVARIGWCR